MPSWAKCAETVLMVDDNHRSSAVADNVRLSAINLLENTPIIVDNYTYFHWNKLEKLVSPYNKRRAEYAIAGYTNMQSGDCCPWPWRPAQWPNGKKSDRYPFDDIYETRYTDRCTPCDTYYRSRKRAKKKVDRIMLVSEVRNETVKMVTLTFPNYIGEDAKEGTKYMKNLVKDFRKDCRTLYNREIDGYDFYEYTIPVDIQCWSNPYEFNVHAHCLWVMDRWDQRDLQESWGHGIPYIEEVKGKYSQRNCVDYATKYCGKDSNGSRNSQAFGKCYGRAFVELESQLMLTAQSLDVLGVFD